MNGKLLESGCPSELIFVSVSLIRYLWWWFTPY